MITCIEIWMENEVLNDSIRKLGMQATRDIKESYAN